RKKSDKGAGEGDGGEGWSTTQQKQLDELLKRKAALQKEQDDEQREDTRKRAAALAIEEQASEDEDPQPVRKKKKVLLPASESDDDHNHDSGNGGEGEEAGQDDREQERSDGDIAMQQPAPAPSRPKPRPAYRGAGTGKLTGGEQAIAEKFDVVQTSNRNQKKSVEMDSAHGDEEGSDEELSQKKAAPAKKAGGAATQTSKTASSKGKARASKQDSSDEDDDEWAKAKHSSSSEAGSDDGRGSSSDEDDVIEMPQKNVKKARTSQKTNPKPRVRVKVADLAVDMKPLVAMAQNCLRNILALSTAWTSDTTITSSRLVMNEELVGDALRAARDSVDKDGKKMVTVRTAYRMLRRGESPENHAQHKQVKDLIWTIASQLRNEVKRKAKVIVEHAYRLNVVQGHKRTQLATWLLTTHAMKVRGGKRGIPNFVFGDIQVVWDDKDNISKEKSHVKADTPFRHPAIAEIIAQQWFMGHAKATTPTEEFSKVPDNLIALVCNSIELGLREVATNTAVSFSNKVFAPKWDDLMSILEAMEHNAPDYYKVTKRQLWESIRARAESGGDIKTKDSDDEDGTFVNWSKLQTVALEAEEPADQHDAGASGSGAKTNPASASTSRRKPSSSGATKKTTGHTGKPSSTSAVPAATSAPSSPSRAKASSSKGKAVGEVAEPEPDAASDDDDGDGRVTDDGRAPGAEELDQLDETEVAA
ncbi:uncharacterized protein B0H18DRAFT_960975, partial [Fomitopsis serialis]|uniref:uncharacterized protein n=1 Tax=Fomitopsis serialis TaxID=139415 RepID=UPI002007B7CE